MANDELIDKILGIVISSHGSLGFSQFRVHSIKPNNEENVYYVKYSFVPRGQAERIYYKLKANTTNLEVLSLEEIPKDKIFEDDN